MTPFVRKGSVFVGHCKSKAIFSVLHSFLILVFSQLGSLVKVFILSLMVFSQSRFPQFMRLSPWFFTVSFVIRSAHDYDFPDSTS